jgi:hypothetical protein
MNKQQLLTRRDVTKSQSGRKNEVRGLLPKIFAFEKRAVYAGVACDGVASTRKFF